jgi:ribonuclease HI
LRKGLIWRIGDGSNIKVWEDNWIPRSSAQHPLGRLNEECPSLVSDFLLPQGHGWDEEKLKIHLAETDVVDILKIRVGKAGSVDFPAWNYTKNGVFTVRSAYHLAMKAKRLEGGAVEASSSCIEHNGWLSLWDAQVPGKVKVHTWRLIENGLAVGAELSSRKIKDGISCLACGRTETLVHRFWSCPHSTAAWSFLSEHTGCALAPPPKLLSSHSDLKGWILDWIGNTDGSLLSLMLMMLYNLWMARNDARDNQRFEDPRSIATRTVVGVEEWLSLRPLPLGPKIRQKEHWLPPEESWHKVNVDGAFHSDSGRGGGGVIVRDHHGAFVSGACHFFPHTADAECAELLACRRGVQLAQEMLIPKVILEVDSTGVAAKLLQSECDRSLNALLVEEIKELMNGFEEISVRSVRRTANEAAHILAKEGCVNKRCKTWFGVNPDCVKDQLVLDLLIE